MEETQNKIRKIANKITDQIPNSEKKPLGRMNFGEENKQPVLS